jgi:hypothetical protein
MKIAIIDETGHVKSVIPCPDNYGVVRVEDDKRCLIYDKYDGTNFSEDLEVKAFIRKKKELHQKIMAAQSTEEIASIISEEGEKGE